MNVSLRRGKLAPTRRAHPPIADAMARSQWDSCGGNFYGSQEQFRTSYCLDFSHPLERAARCEDVMKNSAVCSSRKNRASTPVFPPGAGSAMATTTTTTNYRSDFAADQTCLSKGYTRACPRPGFDRLTANKTNFCMADDLTSSGRIEQTTQQRMMPHPRERPQVEQPTLGTACLGAALSFNMITGAETHEWKREAMRRVQGPRISLNTIQRKERAKLCASKKESPVDIITGRVLVH
jgi:hypothetical protein